MKAIAEQLEKQYPGSNRGQGASVITLSEEIVGGVRPILLMLLGGAALLLVIASINVASLLLLRSENRKREIAVRGALGASQRRLVGQFAIEGFVLATISGALGLAATYGMIQVLLRLVSQWMLLRMPYLAELGLNRHVLLFDMAIVLVVALLFAVTPLFRLTLNEMSVGLASGGRGSAGTVWKRLGSNLVALELAIAMILLTGAGVLGKSFYRLLHVDLKFQSDHLATLQVVVPRAGYEEQEKIPALSRRITERMEALPGVQSASLTSLLPVNRNGNTDWIRFVGKPYNGEHNEVNLRDIGPTYFATLKARLLRGRLFTYADDASRQKVVIINEALAKKYFPGEDPIGKKIGDGALTPSSIKEIVGIVDDIKESSLDTETWPAVYYPFAQDPDHYFSLVIRTSQQEDSLWPAIIAAIHQVAPEVGVADEASLEERIKDSQTAYLHRSSTWLVGGFAAVALLLSVIGLYGVIAYSVSQRTREIGVRMALGAQRSSVYRLVMKEAGWLIFFGVIAGLGGSLLATNVIRDLFFGIASWEGGILVLVAAILGLAAMMASYLPAKRAASVNPVEALRAE
jgi:predicted permease